LGMRVGSSADLRSRWSNSRRPAPRTALRAGRAPQTGVARGAAGLHCVRRQRLEDRLLNRIDGGGSRHTTALSRSSDAALGGGEAAHDDRNAAVACANAAGQPRSCSGTRRYATAHRRTGSAETAPHARRSIANTVSALRRRLRVPAKNSVCLGRASDIDGVVHRSFVTRVESFVSVHLAFRISH
jgi:hypothetical protein